MAFTEQRRIFANFIFQGLDGERAAIEAKYSAKTARSQASRLLKDPEINAYLEGLRTSQQLRTEIESDQWLYETAAVAFSNIQDVVKTETEGKNKGAIVLRANIQDLPREVTAAIKKVGYDALGRLQVTMHAKGPAQTNLARHWGLFDKGIQDLGKELLERIDKVDREDRQTLAEIAKLAIARDLSDGHTG